MMSSGLMGDVNDGVAMGDAMELNSAMESNSAMALNDAMTSSNEASNAMTSSNEASNAMTSSNETMTPRHDMRVTTNTMSPSASRPIPSVGSPTKSRAKQPPPMPKKPASLLQEIQEAPSHVRLRKVPK